MMEIMVLSSQSKQVYDPIRLKWIAATPEERVRQNLLHRMIHELSFPRELISVEKSLREMPHLAYLPSIPTRRLDIVCFGKGLHPSYALYPLIVIECKENIVQKKEAMRQVMGYNHYLQACFFAIADPEGVLVGYHSSFSSEFAQIPFLPSYPELIAAAQS